MRSEYRRGLTLGELILLIEITIFILKSILVAVLDSRVILCFVGEGCKNCFPFFMHYI